MPTGRSLSSCLGGDVDPDRSVTFYVRNLYADRNDDTCGITAVISNRVWDYLQATAA